MEMPDNSVQQPALDPCYSGIGGLPVSPDTTSTWSTDGEVTPAQVEVQSEKKTRVRKPKVMRQVRRRKLSAKKMKKFFVSPVSSVKLIWELAGQSYYMVQFPADKAELFTSELTTLMPSAFHSNSITIDPTGKNTYLPEDVVAVERWKVRESLETLQALAAFGKKNKFDFEGDLLVRAQMTGADGKRLLTLSSAKSNSIIQLPKMGRNKFRPFQKAGIAYALEAKRCFIADEMGLGKTIQAIGVMASVKKFPVLVVCPNTLKLNWEDECQKWLGKKHSIVVLKNMHLSSLVPRRKKGEDPVAVTEMNPTTKARLVRKGVKWLKTHDVIIVNYDKLKKWSEYFVAMSPDVVIFDESHYLKGNSARSRVCMNMMKEISPEYILMLTGTPVMNKPVELIRQLQIMGRMQEFGGVSFFMNRYCSIVNVDMSKLPPLPKPNEDGTMPELTEEQKLGSEMRDALIRKVYENQVELNHRLRSVCYVRREKTDVLTDLPDKVRSTLSFEITNRAEYDRISEDVIGYLGDRAAKDEKFLKSIKKKSKEEQIRCIKERRGSVEYRTSRAEALVKIEILKQAAAIGKLSSVQEWVEDFFEQNPMKKLVLFATHRRIIDELEAMFSDICVTIRGGDNDTKRHQAVEDFQKDKKVKLIIGSLKAAGLGLTLTAASDVAFVELGWTPAIHDQAEDRCHRITQKESVTAYYLLAENTIEEGIAKLIESKRQTVDAVSFGDPLEKVMQTGSILGDLVAELIGKKTTL
jgi:SWI/SNF-related matrix-associated actin-dependent regulator 1 of chromatin subfamily A